MADWEDDLDPYFWRWERAKPIKVRGGIKAQAKQFGKKWWTEKWLSAIEEFGPHRRVARGRSYARKGQILDLKIEPGLISAIVQGSREIPYKVQIQMKAFSAEKAKEFLTNLQSRPLLIASMLNGEIHPDTESLFLKTDVPLFPLKEEGLNAVCSCPDPSNLCKHIAAVFYVVSEELERDPLLLLEIRGIKNPVAQGSAETLFPRPDVEPLPQDPQQFWRIPRLQEIQFKENRISLEKSQKPVILQRLGPFPFWRGEADLLGTLERIYKAVQTVARASGTK